MRTRVSPCDAEHVAVRCLIVDDNERFLEAARSSLGRDGIEVVGTATTTATALQQTKQLRPDVVLVDISLGDESGFELTRQLVDVFPDLASRVVLISTREEQDYSDLIAASPAVGFVPKSHLSAKAVRELVSGKDL
jgi:two-component system, NarL family, nitrate/nitrite response regulator NarL